MFLLIKLLKLKFPQIIKKVYAQIKEIYFKDQNLLLSRS
jgi:hypothetical protein